MGAHARSAILGSCFDTTPVLSGPVRIYVQTDSYQEDISMERRVINPWTWQEQFGFVQTNEIRQPQRILLISGQTSLDAVAAVAAVGDMSGQVGAALDNLETVLRQADMSLANLVRVNFYSTDMDRFLAEGLPVVGQRLTGVEYVTTYLGVVRLALPDLLIEIEATAVA